jgi:ABC-type microcin C transport system duplicated ATPase subunit YejF
VTETREALPDLAAMADYGARIAAALRAGNVVALSGGLGTGKTTLARAILAALGHAGEVPSPTFTIIEAYDAPPLRLAAQHGRTPDAVFEKLKTFLSDEEILEFTYITTLYIMHAVMNRALRLEYDDIEERIVEIAAPEGNGGVGRDFLDTGREPG